ncbi:MAG TPA: Sua5/YciO/YrdC/YwlC family protein [Solirubrobacterales bacterium]|jgi:L-threonylcarbamoyladenylate synthase|nr:Sua5/YciO/YrdC/YwlC family protein [Solirubrobacterales bacterium]
MSAGPKIIKVESGAAATARGALELCIGAGGIAVFPSDGLYGLACDPLDAAAIARIHRLKGRDEGKSSAVMYFSPLAMRELVAGLGPRTAAAISALLPGPVTLIVANPGHRYPFACREDADRLGIRLIGGPLAGAMCPIFQTSANVSGKFAPASLDQVPAEILDQVDLAIDAGTLPGMPSTVVDIATIEEDGSWEVLRTGALSPGDLASSLASVGLG